MMRGATLLWAALATVAGTGLFLLKYEVQAEEQRLSALKRDIVKTEESIHVLKAEWSYLNDPERLREQAERHLGLHPLKPSQIASIDRLPMADPLPSPEATISKLQPEATPTDTQPNAQAAEPPVPSVVPPKTVTQPKTVARNTPPVEKSRKKTPPPVLHEPQRKPALRYAEKKPTPVERAYSAPAAKPAAPVHAPVTVAAAPAPRTYPASQPQPAVSTSGNVMVITSPALMQPELASTRSKP